MIVVEITERNRRKPARVIFNDDGQVELFVAHAQDRGARTRQLTEEEARTHVVTLRERAAKRSDWRAGGAGAEIARRIAEAKARDRSREVPMSISLPKQIKSELDHIARLSGRTPETIIRAAIAAFLKAARRETGRG